jgi:hypothetical protein
MGKLLPGARAVLPWVVAVLAATLLGRELTPAHPPVRAVTPVIQPPDSQPENQKEKQEKKQEIVYEPWEPVST